MGSATDGHRHAVLVVEDDSDTLTALVVYLDRAGFTVEATNSAESALDRLRAGFAPCALVVDVLLPDRDGWWLVEAIREIPSLVTIPVVFYSGVQRRDEERARELGIAAYLVKPSDPRAIATALAEHCPIRLRL